LLHTVRITQTGAGARLAAGCPPRLSGVYVLCGQLTLKSSAYTLPWPYQPWTKTVTVPDDPVVNDTVCCAHPLEDVQVLAVAPPLTPTYA
jgi:hypothetical protein